MRKKYLFLVVQILAILALSASVEVQKPHGFQILSHSGDILYVDGASGVRTSSIGSILSLAGCIPPTVEQPPPADPKDSDGDGVTDDADQCPKTPAGASVDNIGCPIDSDSDGVFDGIDDCPDTPWGAKVDQNGCSNDSDGDTVPDGVDKCPNTPKGVGINALGCQLDADEDGVPEGLDQCPETPEGALVDKNGCPIDSDGDTVPSGIDACPETPRGTPVGPTGCLDASKLDTDGDTVPDKIDRCPSTVAEVEVDAEGCQVIRDRLVLKGIKFRSGSSRIEPESYPILDSVIETLKVHPEIKLEIQGHTDNVGSEASNMRLSEARAKAVYNYLVEKGISPNRLTFKGYGPNNPIAPNDTREGRSQNRRIEFKVIE